MKRPVIGLTCGCPCGIGPEIVKKAASDPFVLDICEPRIYGNAGVKAQNNEECGRLSMEWVDDAVGAVMTKEVSAIVTAPINKAHWKAAGSPFSGHTEYLAHVSGAKNVAMMMASPRLNVTIVTTHIPLADVPKAVTVENICNAVRLTHDFLKRSPRSCRNIAVCGLNPHAGEHGALGNEESLIIIPAIELLRSQNVPVSGPHAADTVFFRAASGEFGAVIAMYHDQGLAPIKTLDFAGTVNITLGLPFIRTSPGHGTADDIAGKGLADHRNMVEAIRMAVELQK